MLGDYAMGLLTAPSTYIGLITGGTGKAAAVAGTQAAKLGVRKVLGNIGQSAVRAAIPEAAMGFGQGVAQEATRVTTGQQEEFTGGRTVTTGIASGIGGGVFGGLGAGAGMLTGKGALSRAENANELLEAARIGAAKKAKIAAEKSKQTLKTADKEKINTVRNTLNALDPAKVAEGRRLKKDLNPSETLEASLGSEVFENIMAAAIRVKDKLNIVDDVLYKQGDTIPAGKEVGDVKVMGDRITTKLYDAMRNGELENLGIGNILREHNLNMDQFSLVYLAEVSQAGRILGIQGQ
jgi:hypothetical protein